MEGTRERNNNKVSQKVKFFQKSITLDPVDRSERFSPFCDPEVMGVNPVSSKLSNSRILGPTNMTVLNF